jgi:hypothetical protein
MPDEIESPPPRPRTAREERAERLAAQLRTNLHRRKAQVRGRDAVATAEGAAGDDEAATDG